MALLYSCHGSQGVSDFYSYQHFESFLNPDTLDVWGMQICVVSFQFQYAWSPALHLPNVKM